MCVSHEFQGHNYIVATVVSASVELSPVGMVSVVKACTKVGLNSSGEGIVAIFSAEKSPKWLSVWYIGQPPR